MHCVAISLHVAVCSTFDMSFILVTKIILQAPCNMLFLKAPLCVKTFYFY